MAKASNVSELLRSIRRRYADCRSYADAGLVIQSDNRNSLRKFKTYFVRPNKFRFEWVGYHPHFGKKAGEHRCVIWSDGKQTFNSYHSNWNKPIEEESLTAAVEGATALSAGAAKIIYELLFDHPSDCGSALLHLHDIRGVWQFPLASGRHQKLTGASCSNFDHEYSDVWIDRNDSSLYKIREHNVITVAEQKAMDVELARLQPDVFGDPEDAHQKKRHERRYVTEYLYTAKEFDAEIDDALFHPAPV